MKIIKLIKDIKSSNFSSTIDTNLKDVSVVGVLLCVAVAFSFSRYANRVLDGTIKINPNNGLNIVDRRKRNKRLKKQLSYLRYKPRKKFLNAKLCP